jgi:DNA-binding NarL/FixJ family response regulator
MPTRLVLVDDHEIVLQGLLTLLQAEAEFEIVGSATNGMEAIAVISETKPDVVVLDIGLPDLDGIEVMKQLRNEGIESRILALSMHSEREYVIEAFSAGAQGYLVKNTALGELINAIRTVMRGKRYLSADLVDIMLDLEQEDAEPGGGIIDRLSEREQEILMRLLQGGTSKEIGYELDVSPKTIDFHRQQIMKKLEVENLIELTRLAIREGLIKP